MHLFLLEKNVDLAKYFEDINWLAKLCYVADIFHRLKSLIALMQGPQTTLISLSDKVSAFISKLKSWENRKSLGNNDNFLQMRDFLQMPETSQIDKEVLFSLVNQHIKSLEHFKSYFGDMDIINRVWVCDPFSVNFDELDLPVTAFDKLIGLSHDTCANAKHRSLSLPEFCIKMKDEYPEWTEMAFRIIVPFVTSYLCECGFSALAGIKTKE